jgi:Beta-lactamase
MAWPVLGREERRRAPLFGSRAWRTAAWGLRLAAMLGGGDVGPGMAIGACGGCGTVLLTVLAMAVALAGCTSHQPGAPSPARVVAQQLARFGATSVIVFVSDHGHSTVATAGTPPPAAGQRFRIGSVTKTFTATMVLQLVDQKRSPSIRPIDALRFAASQPLLFPAGSQWAYSNTNYIALGLVIEKVTGHPFGQELRQRILKPLALSQTELATTRRLPDLHDEGTNPNLPWAAGGIVSDAQDLARFFSALLSGHLVSRASLAKMMQTAPASQDGLGIFAADLPCGRFWGHNGRILDYRTVVDATGNSARIAVISVRGPIGHDPR